MKKLFTTKSIAGIAVFSALAFIIYLIEMPIFASTPASFLKLDLSNVFVMLAGFMYGPIGAIIVTVVKESIHIAVGTTGGVGELANIIITTAYVVLPSIVYLKRKGFKTVVTTLICACVIQVIISVIVNRFINFPFFMGSVPFVPNEASESAFKELYGYIIAFNAIKSVAISGITILVYKKVSLIFKKINLQN
ncbi:MAG: ECF transporter S component [Clostridia bacterium]|nr:ECF transporter S component [Clostridia bacterium]